MKVKIITGFILIFVVMALKANTYEDTGSITFKQPNEVEFTARSWGDKFFHFMETQDGYRIVQDFDGWYYYAILDEHGEFAPSDKYVGIDNPLTESYKLDRSPQQKAEI